MSSLDEVVKVHASKMTRRGLESDCDCITHIRFGIISVGQKCADARITFLKQNVMRPNHTRKTSGAAAKARYERSKLRGHIWSAESPTARAQAEQQYNDSLSPEYKAQLAGTHYNHRKKVSGESATKLGLVQ